MSNSGSASGCSVSLLGDWRFSLVDGSGFSS